MKYKSLGFMLLMSVVLSLNAGSGYSIDKSAISNGGGKSTGLDFVLIGSIGQSDASRVIVGSNFRLSGGFWHQKNPTNNELIFKNSFE